ncbi:MAG: GGDEF domain-containing protein [Lachnospiraceae bacterium]|nr:GGDEF domain-containing protein [Lachnospiraceae bacterium]
MDFTNEIVKFVSDKVGGVVIISDSSDEIVYADGYFTKKYNQDIKGMDSTEIFLWLDDCPELEVDGPAVEWENIDRASKKYYRLNSSKFEKDGKIYSIHLETDITEYMGLNRDITKYMSFFKKLSAFQTAVLQKLSNTFYELLPMLTEYFNVSKAYFLIQREGNMDVITYNKMGDVYSNDRIGLNAKVESAFTMSAEDDILMSSLAPELQEVMSLNGSNEDSTFNMLCNGSVSGQKYAIYFSAWPNMDKDSMKEKTLLSVIKLYVENGIMKEKLRYSSEHDGLTDLYNKAKYLEMMDAEYMDMDSIGIFNFDVNNLKVLNDTKGHEAGDKLLIKAANSIRKVTNNKAHGYRMGGDEFLMIACNVTKEEVDSLKSRWEAELERLNAIEDDINCVVAVGVVYGEKGYNFSELMKKADELMYEDKKSKKKPGEEIR